MKLCTIFQTSCYAVCVCDDGFGGSDCSLTEQQLLDVDSSRAVMCDSLLAVLKASDKSYQLLDAVVGAIKASFSPTEVISSLSIESCALVLFFLCDMTSEGFIVGTQDSTVLSLLETVSAFTFTADSNTSFYSIASRAYSSLEEGIRILITGGKFSFTFGHLSLLSL
jgi:hypothetical protein